MSLKWFGLGRGDSVRVAAVHYEAREHVHIVIEAWTCGHGGVLKTNRRDFHPKNLARRVGKLRRCLWCADPTTDEPLGLDVLHEHGLFLDR